ARRLGIPVSVFLLDESQPWPPALMDVNTGEGEQGKRVEAFRNTLLHDHSVGFFRHPEDLAGQVVEAIARWQASAARWGRPEWREHVGDEGAGQTTASPSTEPTERRKVDEQQWFAARRSRFEQAVFQLVSYVENQKLPRPECFISYAWGNTEQERWVERT